MNKETTIIFMFIFMHVLVCLYMGTNQYHCEKYNNKRQYKYKCKCIHKHEHKKICNKTIKKKTNY